MSDLQIQAKKKAEQLVNNFLHLVDCGDNRYTSKIQHKNAKECAKIAVNEIISTYDADWCKLDFWTDELSSTIKFWQEVLNQIEQL